MKKSQAWVQKSLKILIFQISTEETLLQTQSFTQFKVPMQDMIKIAE